MWYFFITLTIAMTIASYYLSKAKKRSVHSQRLGVDKIFGSKAATVFWASSVLLIIILNSLESPPVGKNLKHIRNQSEIVTQQALGQYVAEQFSQSLTPGAKVLIIDLIKGEIDRRFHEAFIAGFSAGSKAGGISVKGEIIEFPDQAAAEESSLSEMLFLTAEMFDAIIDKHSDCSAVISLVGVPNGYETSRTWLKVNEGDILLGVVSDDVFLLGGMIINNDITACIVPKRRYSYDNVASLEASTVEEIFSQRYYYVTSSNIIGVMRQDRRIFKIQRRI